MTSCLHPQLDHVTSTPAASASLLLSAPLGGRGVAYCSSAAQRGANRSGPMALRRALLAAALAAAAAEVNVSCQIFEETMICDNAAQGVVRGEIRTCSG